MPMDTDGTFQSMGSSCKRCVDISALKVHVEHTIGFPFGIDQWRTGFERFFGIDDWREVIILNLDKV
jgi:hypothetical protein